MPRLAKIIVLSVAEQADLMAIIKKGTHKSRNITRVRILLLLAAGKSRVAMESELGISTGQYWRTKQRYVAGGWPRRWKSGRAAANRPK